MSHWRRHVTVGRWRLDVELYRTRYRPRKRRDRLWAYWRGGQATPGPWWQVFILNRVSLTLAHDRTVFGWDDPVNDPEARLRDVLDLPEEETT